MQFLDDAREVTHLDGFETMTLDDQIDYAEWCVTVAQAHLDDLKRKKAELDAHYDAQYAEYCALENGRLTCEADAAECNDCKTAEGPHVS